MGLRLRVRVRGRVKVRVMVRVMVRMRGERARSKRRVLTHRGTKDAQCLSEMAPRLC